MIIPEIEICVRYKNPVKKSDFFCINHSDDAIEAFREIFNADTIGWREEAILLCLNRGNRVLGYYKLSSGGLTGTVVDQRMVMTIALNTAGTTSIMLAHNHPSGQLRPSPADEEVTRKIKHACDILDIRFLDHLIITEEGCYSFADNGNL